MAKRVTLAARFAATHAAAPSRARARRRLADATLRALAPQPAAAAVTAYAGVARKLAARMEKAIDAAIEDGLDVVRLDELERKLMAMTNGMARNARAAAKRIEQQARREVARMLVVKLPPPDELDRVLRDLFVEQNMRYFRAMVLDQTAALQESLGAGAPTRPSASLVRHRAVLIATDQSWKLEGQAVQRWSVASGSDEYYWVDRGDGRVREGHARLHRTLQRFSDPPDTGRKEGRNNPGQAVHCRCCAVPREAFELAK